MDKMNKTVILGLVLLTVLTGCGSGGEEQTSSDTTSPTLTSIAPSLLQTTSVSASSIALSWQDNADNEEGFHLERAEDEDFTAATVIDIEADETGYTDTGLSAETTYYYRISAYLGQQTSDYSNTFEATTDPLTAEGVTINETGFETGTDESPYTLNSWEADGFDPAWVQGFNQERAHIDTEHAHTGNGSLRINYPAGTYLPYNNGAQVPLMFTPREEVYISYWLQFSENFDWGDDNEGGKLPGLASGNLCSGGSRCDGSNGFSARLMWRPGGKAVLYLYHMDKPGSYGEDMTLVTNTVDVYFQQGQWYQVIERVKINTGNNNDGEVQIWINGEEALLRTDLRFVTDGSLIDTFYFSTFHGGADASWAPSVDCYIWYDDLRIYYY
jgi:hypothetical protein